MSNQQLQGIATLILPIRNEARHIEGAIRSLASGNSLRYLREIIIVDGMSTDGTDAIVAGISVPGIDIVLLQNERRTVPFAMNMAIRIAKGDVIVRADAHAEYPDNYVATLVEALFEQGADNVGGMCMTKAPSQSAEAQASAIAMSSRFGVGNAYFRVGVPAPRLVDTVPFGCYRKDVFSRIGFYDEEMTRNQDDELNARLTKVGGKILLLPDVKITYYTRAKLNQTFKQMYQYGLFKPLGNFKAGYVTSGRQLAPALFTLYLLLLPVALLLLSHPVLCLAGLIAYLAGAAYSSIAATDALRNPRLTALVIYAFLGMHVSYGWGYLQGLWNLTWSRTAVHQNLALSR